MVSKCSNGKDDSDDDDGLSKKLNEIEIGRFESPEESPKIANISQEQAMIVEEFNQSDLLPPPPKKSKKDKFPTRFYSDAGFANQLLFMGSMSSLAWSFLSSSSFVSLMVAGIYLFNIWFRSKTLRFYLRHRICNTSSFVCLEAIWRSTVGRTKSGRIIVAFASLLVATALSSANIISFSSRLKMNWAPYPEGFRQESINYKKLRPVPDIDLKNGKENVPLNLQTPSLNFNVFDPFSPVEIVSQSSLDLYKTSEEAKRSSNKLNKKNFVDYLKLAIEKESKVIFHHAMSNLSMKSKCQVSYLFYCLLELKKKGFVNVLQKQPYADIVITKGPKSFNMAHL
ncbi:hypothetical protein HELRODRAFT_180901 [Helobdella robusta]|uniref:Rad21/Rec8-like protein C-terminal eukaryotic domain-containing protein n=1 Tax=Helobdella robusta TaxID=6412 RepID=T1FGE2_HELRO|nr:hypothetical protein HELRODRAFT_180901 [Helobdella robusta]ESN93374.1 hypothetical protein HELRODRAFT_180901 [Helobdella robusta]